MLVLSRRKNDSIVIDDCIVVTVIEIRGDKVRIGIEAPRELPVLREEVFDAIRRRSYAPTGSEKPGEEAFLHAIDENPRDFDLLLVYADWLEEQGDARADMIRCEVERRLPASE